VTGAEIFLAKGDSVSWVIRDGRLCGYIIAGRDSLPWAYMIPIGAVLEDIKQTIEGSDISFPLKRHSQSTTQSSTYHQPNTHLVAVEPAKQLEFSPADDTLSWPSTQQNQFESIPAFAGYFGGIGAAIAQPFPTQRLTFDTSQEAEEDSADTSTNIWDRLKFKGKNKRVLYAEDSLSLLDGPRLEPNTWASTESDNTLVEHSSFVPKPYQKYEHYRQYKSMFRLSVYVNPLFKFLVTFALCGAYWVTAIAWAGEGALTENQMRLCTTTKIAIIVALSQHISNFFKSLRWSYDGLSWRGIPGTWRK
jgi:hypothetical protein